MLQHCSHGMKINISPPLAMRRRILWTLEGHCMERKCGLLELPQMPCRSSWVRTMVVVEAILMMVALVVAVNVCLCKTHRASIQIGRLSS